MGCDIHLFVEKRIPKVGWRIDHSRDWDSDFGRRSYTAFSMLADVRNGYGHDIEPIFEPRGVPEDASLLYKGHVEDYGGGGHSHSYATLQELKDYRARMNGRFFPQRGVLSAVQYDAFKASGIPPKEWSGGIGGRKIKTVSPEAYEKLGPLRAAGTTNWRGTPDMVTSEGDIIYVQAEWQRPYVQEGDFLSELVSALTEESDGRPDDIRIVFFFDN